MTTTFDAYAVEFSDSLDGGAALGPVPLPRPLHHRVRRGVRHTENWLQLVRFATVGASGYVVNLIVFAVCVHVVALDYRVASVVAFLVSVINNFWLNRHWTFDAKHDAPAGQGVRFFVVSVAAFGFTEFVLITLVSSAGLDKVVAQAIAVASATPLSFLGQKLWSFRA
jgi:dolichol-phosphate mannosyltransferase